MHRDRSEPGVDIRPADRRPASSRTRTRTHATSIAKGYDSHPEGITVELCVMDLRSPTAHMLAAYPPAVWDEFRSDDLNAGTVSYLRTACTDVSISAVERRAVTDPVALQSRSLQSRSQSAARL